MDNLADGTEYDRLNKVTKEQKRKLMELTEKGSKCLEMFKTAQYRNQKEWWWRKTSAILNSMPGLGAVKTAKQWEKTYKDIKMYARKKAVNLNMEPLPPPEANDGLFGPRVELMGGSAVREPMLTETTEFNGQEHTYTFPETINDPMMPQGPTESIVLGGVNQPVPGFSEEFPSFYHVGPTTSASPQLPQQELKEKPGKAPRSRQKRKVKKFPDVFPSHNTSLSGESLEECKTFLDTKINLLERIARAQEAQARVALENAKHFETFVGLVGRLLDKT